jgi:nucleoid-associated protein YgaU
MADRGEGLRVRFAKIPGETPAAVLRQPLYLPAVLEGFGWTEEFSHSEYDTIRAGQFSQPAMGPVTARRLRAVDDVEALTMTWEPAWLVEQGVDPDDVHDELFAAGRSRKPVELLASLKLNEAPLLRMAITVRSIGLQLRRGQPDTLYYSLKFTEWRNAEVGRKGAGSAGGALPTTHKLTATDTLHSLAMRYYKSARAWPVIAEANAIRGVGQSTALVRMARFRVGSKIKIPAAGIVSGTSTAGTVTRG